MEKNITCLNCAYYINTIDEPSKCILMNYYVKMFETCSYAKEKKEKN